MEPRGYGLRVFVVKIICDGIWQDLRVKEMPYMGMAFFYQARAFKSELTTHRISNKLEAQEP
jgi:hypothetical protein